MTVLEDAATFAQDPELKAPLTAAVVDAALTVMAEEPTVDFHGQRGSLGTQVLTDPDTYATRFAWAASTDEATVAAWIADDKATALDLLPAVIADVWNAVAGITRY